MAFWGVILKPGEPYTLHSDGGSRRLRISQASIVEGCKTLTNGTTKSVVHCTVGNEEPIVLCTMATRTGYRCQFSLEFQESEDVVFSTTGHHRIHLAGYYMRPSTTTTTTTATTVIAAEKTTRDHCFNINDIDKTMIDHCSINDSRLLENDPCDRYIVGSFIPDNLPTIRVRVEEFDDGKRIRGKPVGEELVSSSDASRLQLICSEKKSEVQNSELLVESPQLEELVERDLIRNDDKEPHRIDVDIQDENTKGINNVIAGMTENEEIQPNTIEDVIKNFTAEMTENEEIQPDTIEDVIKNFTVEMTGNEEIQPDTIEINNVFAGMVENEEIQPDTIEDVIKNFTAEMTENEEIQLDTIETNNVIAGMAENEEIQPDTTEDMIKNVIAEMAENEENQPDTIEIYNINAAMTESEEIVPDSDDNSDNEAGNVSTDNRAMLRMQNIKKSIVEYDKVVVESIGTNIKEGSNMNTIGCIQKESLPDDSEMLHIEGGDVTTRDHCKLKKKKINKNNMLDKEKSQNITKERKQIEVVDEDIIAGSVNSEEKSCMNTNSKDDMGDDGLYLKGAKDADVEDGKANGGVMIGSNSCKSGGYFDEGETRKLNGGTADEGNEDGTSKLGFCNMANQTQEEMLANDNNSFTPSVGLGLEVPPTLKLKKKKKKKGLISVAACNNMQSEILGSNDDGCSSNGLLSTSVIHDEDHDSFVPSTVFDAGFSVKLKKKKRKSGFKESKMDVENVRENQNQPVDERNNNICVNDENARYKDNVDDVDMPQEYFPINNQKVVDLSVPKESKKIKKVKVKACKIQDKSINNDSISQDIVLAPTPSSDLKPKLHNENNSFMPSVELGLEVPPILKLKKKKKKKGVISVAACNNIQSEILGSSDNGCSSNGLLSMGLIHDQDHDLFVPSTVFDAGGSVKLKKKRKSGFKESKRVVDNVRENLNQPVDERNNIICVKDENIRYKYNVDDTDVPQEYFPINNQKVVDVSVSKESKKIMEVKVKAHKIKDLSINNDPISQDIVLAPTPSDLKPKLQNEKEVADSSFLKENKKQKKRKLKTSKIYDNTTKTDTITVLALSANVQNSKPVADSSVLKEKGKLKKRKMETSQIPTKFTMTENNFRTSVLALPAHILNSKCLSINANTPTIESQSTTKKIKLSTANAEPKIEAEKMETEIMFKSGLSSV